MLFRSGGSALLALLGFAAAWRFRPQDNIRQLRWTLRTVKLEESTTPPGTHSKDAS